MAFQYTGDSQMIDSSEGVLCADEHMFENEVLFNNAKELADSEICFNDSSFIPVIDTTSRTISNLSHDKPLTGSSVSGFANFEVELDQSSIEFGNNPPSEMAFGPFLAPLDKEVASSPDEFAGAVNGSWLDPLPSELRDVDGCFPIVVAPLEEVLEDDPCSSSDSESSDEDEDEINNTTTADPHISSLADGVTLHNNSPPRKRKIFPVKSTWSREISKNKRLRGEGYVGYRRKDKKNNSIMIHDSPKEPKKLGPRCNGAICRKWKTRKCEDVSDEGRSRLFSDFWSKMKWDDRKMFIASLVDFKTPARKSKNPMAKSRSVSYAYHLVIDSKRLPVCQTMFLNTFGIKNSTIRHWLSNYAKFGASNDSNTLTPEVHCQTPKDQHSLLDDNNHLSEDQSVTNRSKTNLKLRNDHCEEFLRKMPKMPSHYCRSTTRRLYLQMEIKSLAQFYALYCEKSKKDGIKPLNPCSFSNKCKLNSISIFHPRKDLCDTCFMHKMGNLPDEEHQRHLSLKTRAREEKTKDKISAEKGELHVLCADVMAVKLLPFIQASKAYYKMKLACHNYTVYNLVNHDVMCYWFTEGEGGCVASTFATCLVREIERLLEGNKKEVVIFTDGCTNQNRNSIMANALLSVSMKQKDTIHQKFLEKGHTEMEADSVHSSLDTALTNKEIFLPHEFISLTKCARRSPPYRATLMYHGDFKDFSVTTKMRYPSIRPGNKPGEPVVVDLRWLKYTPEGTIYYKINFDDEFKALPRRAKNVVPQDFPPLYKNSIPIPKDKWDDLQSLKTLMPPETWSFYDNLSHEASGWRQQKKKNNNTKKNTKL